MKVLTLTQPYATLVVIGAKRIETRSWNTFLRARIAIQAAKGFPQWAKDTCYEEPFISVLRKYFDAIDPVPLLPVGSVIGEVDLTGSMETSRLLAHRDQFGLTEQEEAFGDYHPGRYGFLLANATAYPTAIPAKGALGFWNWEKT